MATRSRKQSIPDMSKPLTPAQIAAQLREADEHYDTIIAAEAHSAHRWIPRFDSISRVPKEALAACAVVILLSLGAFLGGVGQAWMKNNQTNHDIAMAMRTAIPVVRGLDIDVDPGKYNGKLMDVVLTITKGGVYKSGKGLYLAEHDGGVTAVIFESAFPGFLAEGEKPESIVARYVGKTVRVRGTVRSFALQKDGEKRMSIIVYAPGLISELPGN